MKTKSLYLGVMLLVLFLSLDNVSASAKVTVYEFAEYMCRYSAAVEGFDEDVASRLGENIPGWEAAIPAIKDKYGDEVEIIFKNFLVHGVDAAEAAEAAECAREQGKFQKMHDKLFEELGDYDTGDLSEFARDIGLDGGEFDECMSSGRMADVVESDNDVAKHWGVTGTPTFFIGGEHGTKIVGAQPFSEFEKVIDPMLNGGQSGTSCVQQGDSCCKGDVCAGTFLNCVEGTMAECSGCTADCIPKCKCVPVNPTTPSIEAKITLDKSEYKFGETAQVNFHATVYSVSEDPDISVTAYYPSGSSKQLDLSGSCSEVVSEPCALGGGCQYPSRVCEYKGKVSITEKGEYSVTGVAVLEGASARASASFRTAAQSGDSALRMKLYVDSEIPVGESGRITATLSTNSPNVPAGNSKVSVWITQPNGIVTELQLDKGSCVAAGCVCPVYAQEAGIAKPSADCVCTYGESCEFIGYYTPSDSGWHTINAKAETYGKGGPAYTATASANFNANPGGDIIYVRMGQKFDLKLSQTAEVVDYSNIRLTFDGIGGEKCIGCARQASFTVSQSAFEGAPTAISRVLVAEGQTVETINGLKLTCSELGDKDGTFLVSGAGDSSGSVAVKISPSQSSIKLGEMAKYDIVVRDLHEGGSSSYTYLVKVGGLPFAADYEKEVTVRANSEVTVPLYIYTSKYGSMDETTKTDVSGAYNIGPKTDVSGAYNVASDVVPSVRPAPGSAEEAAVANVEVGGMATNVEVVEEVISDEKVAVSPTQAASGRVYKFTVYVSSEGGSQATASAILNVLYGQPPAPPQDTLKLALSQGWNLMSLPGEGKLSKGTCASVDDLYAFVYIKEKDQYMTMEQAKNYMGEAKLAEYLRENSFWVYSFKECGMEFALETATSFQDISLDGDWNFVPITQDMQGNTLSGISGDCDFEKLYYWNAGAQDWVKMDMSGKLGSSTYPLYTGFVGKTTGSCSFGWGAVLSPPPLPE